MNEQQGHIGASEETRHRDFGDGDVTQHVARPDEEKPQFWQSSRTQFDEAPAWVSASGDQSGQHRRSPLTLLLAGAVAVLAAVVVTYYLARGSVAPEPPRASSQPTVTRSVEPGSDPKTTSSASSTTSTETSQTSAADSASDETQPSGSEQSGTDSGATSTVTTTAQGAPAAPPQDKNAPQTNASQPTPSSSTAVSKETSASVAWPAATTVTCGRDDAAGSLEGRGVRLGTAHPHTSCAFAEQAASKIQAVVRQDPSVTNFEVTQYSAYRASLGTYDDAEIRVFCHRSNHLSHCVSRESVNPNAGVDMYVADPGLG